MVPVQVCFFPTNASVNTAMFCCQVPNALSQQRRDNFLLFVYRTGRSVLTRRNLALVVSIHYAAAMVYTHMVFDAVHGRHSVAFRCS